MVLFHKVKKQKFYHVNKYKLFIGDKKNIYRIFIKNSVHVLIKPGRFFNYDLLINKKQLIEV